MVLQYELQCEVFSSLPAGRAGEVNPCLLPLPCSNVGKAGVVKSAHEFLLPMQVTGRGGKVMLAGEQPVSRLVRSRMFHALGLRTACVATACTMC